MITIYHNKRCGTSRNVLDILKKKNPDVKVIEYLKDILSVDELTAIIKKLKIKPHDLIRTKESVYQKKYNGKNLTDAQWLQAIHEHPVLMERPVVINGNKAVIARPADKVHDIL